MEARNAFFIYWSALSKGLRAISLDAARPTLFRMATGNGVEYVGKRAQVSTFCTRNGFKATEVGEPKREVTVLHGEFDASLGEVEVCDVELTPTF